MATEILVLTMEDINTSPAGLHINIVTKEGKQINFTPEATQEVINDFTYWLEV